MCFRLFKVRNDVVFCFLMYVILTAGLSQVFLGLPRDTYVRRSGKGVHVGLQKVPRFLFSKEGHRNLSDYLKSLLERSQAMAQTAFVANFTADSSRNDDIPVIDVGEGGYEEDDEGAIPEQGMVHVISQAPDGSFGNIQSAVDTHVQDIQTRPETAVSHSVHPVGHSVVHAEGYGSLASAQPQSQPPTHLQQSHLGNTVNSASAAGVIHQHRVPPVPAGRSHPHPANHPPHPEVQSAHHGSPRDGEDHAEAATLNPDRIIYNRVGKCGSTTVVNLLKGLGIRNHYHLQSSAVYRERQLTQQEQVCVGGLLSDISREDSQCSETGI